MTLDNALPARNGRATGLRHAPDVFNASPNPYVLVTPDLVIADANEAYLRATLSRREDILGCCIFDAFPGSPTEPGRESVQVVRSSMLRVVESGRPDALALVRYDIARKRPDGGQDFEERYWSATHVPILDESGRVAFVLQHTVDVTELHELRQQATERRSRSGVPRALIEGDVLRRAEHVQAANLQLETDLRRLTGLFTQAPGFMAVLRGPDHVFELANDAYLRLVGRSDLIGKPVRKALPDVEGQEYFALLDKVYATGEPVVGRSARIAFRPRPDAPLQEVFADFVYQPIRDRGEVVGIFVQGHDVTEQVLARERQQRLLEDLRATEERLTLALSTGWIGVFEWDIGGDRLTISGPIAQLFGIPPERAEEGLPIAAYMAAIDRHDIDRVKAALRRSLAAGVPYEEEYRLCGPEGVRRTVLARGRVEADPSGHGRRFIGAIIDVTDRKLAESAVRESEERLRLALEASRMGDWSWDIGTDLVTLSPRAAEIFGLPSGTKMTWTAVCQLIHPDDREPVKAAIEHALAAGTGYDLEYRVRSSATQAEVWVSARGRPFYDGSGRPTGAFGILEDVTTRKNAEEAERLLIREVDHRAKNIMAVVQSLIRLTPFEDRDHYVATMTGRINALSRAHSLLSQNRWVGAPLADLVRQELTPYTSGVDQFTVEGPPIEMKAEATQPLTLIFHELTTNASKHGSLSRPGGAVSVRWRRLPDDRIEIDWRESGGPPVDEPRRKGFGSTLIAGAVDQLAGGEIEKRWSRSGLHCTLRMDAEVTVPRSVAVGKTPGKIGTGPARALRSSHVLVVEDEGLIAMEIGHTLSAAGARVIGPVSSLEEGLLAALREGFDIAVLDMNLKGKSAVPIAKLLEAQRKPFVILTGYEQPEIAHDWILHKPVVPGDLLAALESALQAPRTAPPGPG